MTRTVETKVRVLRNGAQYAELQTSPNAAPTIRCSDSAAIKMSLAGEFRPNPAVDWLRDELQAVLVIDGTEYPVGIFLPASVEESESEGLKTLRVEAYDRCWRVQTQNNGGSYEVNGGQNYLQVIEGMLSGSGIARVLATPNASILDVGRVWIGDTTRLAMINELLAEINYKQLWFTPEGVAVLEPYAEPTADRIQHTLDGDKVTSLLLPELRKQTDLYSMPNTFVVVCATPDKSSILSATAVNNSPSSPASVIRRGRTITKVVKVKNIADQTALQEYADRLRNESMLRGETIQVQTALLPGYGVADVVALHFGDLSALCVDHSWSMEFRPGGTMTHTLERVVVNLD